MAARMEYSYKLDANRNSLGRHVMRLIWKCNIYRARVDTADFLVGGFERILVVRTISLCKKRQSANWRRIDLAGSGFSAISCTDREGMASRTIRMVRSCAIAILLTILWERWLTVMRLRRHFIVDHARTALL